MRMPGLAWLCYECLDKLGKPETIFAIKMGIIIETTIKNNQSLNEVRNSETNNRKEEKMGENKIRRREKRDRENMDMDKIEVVEVSVEINGEEIQSDPQNEIIMENVEIVGDEQTENAKKEKSKEQEKREGRICYFWIKEKCKFGNNCRNAHPEICKTIMEKGKCPGNCGK